MGDKLVVGETDFSKIVPFNVVHPQILIEGFPLSITCVDHLGHKMFIGTEEGSILEYNIEEDPFTITLSQVYKQVITKMSKLLILEKSRSLAILSEGLVSISDYSQPTLNLVLLPRIKGITCIERSLFQNNNRSDTLAVGVKRGVIIYSISPCEAIENELIPLPYTPTSFQFIEETKIITSTRRGIYLVDTAARSHQEIFSVNESSLTSAMAKSHYMAAHVASVPKLNSASNEVIFNPNEDFVYCTKDTQCYKVNMQTKISEALFQWTAQPSHITVDDYYTVALIESIIEIRSLKTGSILQQFAIGQGTIMNVGELIYIASAKNVWRLLPLDFDEQIDELLAQNRFEDAEAFINELDFATVQEKQSNVIKVRGVYAQYLFNVKKQYAEAVSVLEKLNASPVDVLGLYPDIMDNAPEYQSDKEALHILGLYLSKERVKLITYRNELTSQMDQKAKSAINKSPYFDTSIEDALSDCKCLLEFVETALLQVYLTTNSPLLGSLLRVENSCNYERTVALLIRFKKNNELIDFYKAKGQHQKALTFMKMVSENNDYEHMVSYLQHLDLNKHVDTVLEFAKYPLETNPAQGIKIFTENYQQITSENKMKIFEFLDKLSSELGIQYLENLVNNNFDNDVNINTKLLLKYLQICMEQPKNQTARQNFENFIYYNNYYRETDILDALPKQKFLIEQTHLLSRLHRYEEALEIFIYDIQDFKMAEDFCIRHYKHNSSLSNTLFTYLYRLYIQSENKNDQETIKFLNNHGYKLDAGKVFQTNSDNNLT
ncbi:Vam6/Vps39-like protein [Boothiomyces sp. JEL0838]|nr:Vam6/Vps39-like protein [Boothiomyces sp. JEL0838]